MCIFCVLPSGSCGELPQLSLMTMGAKARRPSTQCFLMLSKMLRGKWMCRSHRNTMLWLSCGRKCKEALKYVCYIQMTSKSFLQPGKRSVWFVCVSWCKTSGCSHALYRFLHGLLGLTRAEAVFRSVLGMSGLPSRQQPIGHLDMSDSPVIPPWQHWQSTDGSTSVQTSSCSILPWVGYACVRDRDSHRMV